MKPFSKSDAELYRAASGADRQTGYRGRLKSNLRADHECPLASDQPDAPDWRGNGRDRAREITEMWHLVTPRKTETARWQRSVLIIAALSALSWMVVVFIAIGLLSAL